MGLDQYWYMHPTAEERAEALLEDKEIDAEQIGYHRKFHELNDFMGDLFFREHPKEMEFNCAEFTITPEILQEIEDFNIAGPYSDELDKAIERIKAAHAAGREVFYHPWW